MLYKNKCRLNLHKISNNLHLITAYILATNTDIIKCVTKEIAGKSENQLFHNYDGFSHQIMYKYLIKFPILS